MPELIRYRYVPGETYSHRQQIDVLVEMPNSPPVTDRAVVRGTLTAVERHDDKSVTLQLESSVEEQLTVARPIPGASARFRISRRGELLHAEPTPPAFPFIVFPLEPIEVKKAWISVENILDRQVAMSHTMGMIEDFEGERVAHLVSEGSAVGEPSIEFQAVRLFALAKGRPLVQRCVTKYFFKEMGTTLVVVEERAD